MSKKSSTFARFFGATHRTPAVARVVVQASPGGGIGRRVGLKHQWETVPVRSRPWVHAANITFTSGTPKEKINKIIRSGGRLKQPLSTQNRLTARRVTKKEVYAMIIVPVKEGENIERAIKKFKRKFDKTGVKRIKMAHARYVQSLHAHDDM